MPAIKVGMLVRSEKWNETGIVYEIGDCMKSVCGKEVLRIKSAPGVVSEFHTDSFIQVQRVWLCLSDAGHNGYFVWEVMEETGGVTKEHRISNAMFTECRDDSRVLIQCFHFFTKEKAQEHIDYYNENEWLNHHIMIGE